MMTLFAPAYAPWVCRSTGLSSKRVRTPARPVWPAAFPAQRPLPFFSEGSEAGREWLIYDVGGARSLVRDTPSSRGAAFHSNC